MSLKLYAILPALGVLFFAEGAAGSNSPLTTAAQVKRLSADEVHAQPAVSLKGIVTETIPEWWGFSLQDATTGIYVSAGKQAAELRPGQIVEVAGHAGAGNFAPMVVADQVRVAGDGALPTPRPASWRTLATGACDNEYVEVEGVVRSVGRVEPPSWEWPATALRLDVGGNLIWAYTRGDGALERERLVDSTVHVHAVCIVFSNSRRQFQGSSLLIPGPRQVKVVEPGPRDPFGAPSQPIHRVFGFSSVAPSFHRIKVEGIVTARFPAALYVQQGNDGIRVRTQSGNGVRPGDRVEVVGFPAADGYSIVLEDALVRVRTHGAEPKPLDVTADAVSQRLAARVPASQGAVLLRMTGLVLDRTRSATDDVLILQDGTTVFNARLAAGGGRGLGTLEPGSRIALTGVCAVQVDERGLPRSFELLLRSPGDVQVLARPSWLTRTVALRAAGALLALAIAAIVWVGLLRRRVRQQTEAIRRAHDELEERVRERTAELQETTDLLRTSEQRLRLAVENFPSTFVIYDRERRIQFINERGAHLAGVESHQARGRRDEELFPKATTDCYLPALQRCADTRTPQTTECELERGGTVVSLIINYVPVVNERGELSQILGITHDLTERKRLQEQLHHAQKLESVGQLAGGVAHDFNNMLTVINGYAELLLEALPQTDDVRGPIQEIANAAQRAAALTRQLLTFSRRQMTAPKTIVLDELVLNLEKLLRRLIGEDIELQLSLGARTGLIHADPGHIEQAIVNLAVNARDAMPEGGQLRIETAAFHADEQYASTRVDLQPGDYIRLTVSDTGVGMTPETRRRAFEPFFTTKEQGKGTGLGLSIVYGVVKQSGGTIDVQSEPGRRTSFHLLFPAVAKPQVAEEDLTAPAAPGVSGSETILVAEDEAGVRRFIRQVLEPSGYTVLEAVNGRDALELASDPSKGIDMLLTDVVMPGMSGVSLGERFAELRPGAPVLHMSGYTDRLWRQDIAGALIEKPFTPASLLLRVREVLDSAKSDTTKGKGTLGDRR